MRSRQNCTVGNTYDADLDKMLTQNFSDKISNVKTKNN